MPKVVGYTLADPTIQSIFSIAVSRQSDGQSGYTFVVNVGYELKDTEGEVQKTGSIDFSATATQIATLSLTQLLAADNTLARIKALENYDS